MGHNLPLDLVMLQHGAHLLEPLLDALLTPPSPCVDIATPSTVIHHVYDTSELVMLN